MAVQFAFLAALTVRWSSTWQLPGVVVVAGWVLRAAGVVLAAVGAFHLGGALTPQPVPRPGAVLVVHGVYRHIRHPIYSGLLLYAAGSILVHAHPVNLGAGGGLLVLLMAKARWEESMLLSAVPDYHQYARWTGRFMPDLGRLRG